MKQMLVYVFRFTNECCHSRFIPFFALCFFFILFGRCGVQRQVEKGALTISYDFFVVVVIRLALNVFYFCMHHLVVLWLLSVATECVQHSHIKYKLVRKYYDNVAAVASALASAATTVWLPFIRCVLRSGKYYIHFNFRFPSFFSHLVCVHACLGVGFFFFPLWITHFIYSYSCNNRWWCVSTFA